MQTLLPAQQSPRHPRSFSAAQKWEQHYAPHFKQNQMILMKRLLKVRIFSRPGTQDIVMGKTHYVHGILVSKYDNSLYGHIFPNSYFHHNHTVLESIHPYHQITLCLVLLSHLNFHLHISLHPWTYIFTHLISLLVDDSMCLFLQGIL